LTLTAKRLFRERAFVALGNRAVRAAFPDVHDGRRTTSVIVSQRFANFFHGKRTRPRRARHRRTHCRSSPPRRPHPAARKGEFGSSRPRASRHGREDRTLPAIGSPRCRVPRADPRPPRWRPADPRRADPRRARSLPGGTHAKGSRHAGPRLAVLRPGGPRLAARLAPGGQAASARKPICHT
jgi:hypothetical protein